MVLGLPAGEAFFTSLSELLEAIEGLATAVLPGDDLAPTAADEAAKLLGTTLELFKELAVGEENLLLLELAVALGIIEGFGISWLMGPTVDVLLGLLLATTGALRGFSFSQAVSTSRTLKTPRTTEIFITKKPA
jgi:hypothetical protein